ncbi:hypothetical protein EMCG_04898 [[Emmonsia] crescens]|uniref:C2H2-type domain-containing protein n=1 Tax=[Emmonsia] crescens TaxID=73230 RepID=A0A0G2HRP1_9EURO|nr:hypothetical protein EMCG_04898 [Emmonsia crescens UAMH 3008]
MAQEMPAVKVEGSEPRQTEPPKNATGQIYCSRPGCHNHISHFKTPSEWNKHMNKHGRPYRCTIPGCDQQFARASGMRRHVLEIHQVNSKEKWMCPYSDCDRSSGKGFSRKAQLTIHIHSLHPKQDCSESLHAEITQLQREVKEMNSRLNKMGMKLEQLRQQTGKDTRFTLSFLCGA